MGGCGKSAAEPSSSRTPPSPSASTNSPAPVYAPTPTDPPPTYADATEFALTAEAVGGTFLKLGPVPVIVELHRPKGENPNHFLERIDADGADGNTRSPVDEYVPTGDR